MTYQLVITPNSDYHINHVETDEYVGWLVKAGSGFIVYRVRMLGRRQKVAIIKSVDEAVSTFADFNEKNPPRWLGGAKAKRYDKWVFYGFLTVERQETRRWIVFRNRDVLEDSCGRDAIFKTPDEAKRAADAHMGDGFPNSPTIHDGFSWSPPARVPDHPLYQSVPPAAA